MLPALALRKSADLAELNRRRRNTKIEVPQSTFAQLNRNKEPLIKSFANVNLATGDNIAQDQFRRDLSVCFSNMKTMPKYTRNRILARVNEMEKAATHQSAELGAKGGEEARERIRTKFKRDQDEETLKLNRILELTAY